MVRARVWRLPELARRVVLAASIFSIGCTKDIEITPPLEPALGPVASVEVRAESPTLPWTSSMLVTAVARNAAGQALVGPVATWTSSDPARVEVSRYQGEAGNLSAIARAFGVGEVTITATVDGKSGVARISAVLHPYISVSVWPDTSRILVSQRRVLNVQRFGGITHSPMTVRAGVIWESSNPSVASVDNSGAVTAVGEGHATITAVASNRRMPAQVFVFRHPSPLELTSLTTGDRHACGLTPTGAAYCWGHNDYGQLGSEMPMDRCGAYQTADGWIVSARFFRCSETPAPVSTALRFTSISAGLRQTCALTAVGDAYCWGANINGASGTGIADTILRTPTRVTGGLTFRSIDVGRNAQVCAITTSYAAYCWGSNFTGALGDGTLIDRTAPTAVAGGHAWQVIRAGRAACGLTIEDVAYCWGANANGEAAVPVGSETTSPTPVAGDLRFKQLGSSCGLVADGSAYCWGQASYGLVTYTPTPLAGGLAFASLARGSRCGLTVDGGVYCWSFQPRLITPVRNAPNFPVRAIDVGSAIACATDLGGTAHCWGHANTAFWQNEESVILSFTGPPRRVGGQ